MLSSIGLTNLIIVYGIPGSGKSTLSQNLKNALELIKYRVVIIDPDLFEDENDQVEIRWKKSREKSLNTLNSYLNSQEYNIIIYEDTLLLSSMRKKLFKMVLKSSGRLCELFLKIDWKEVKLRNDVRKINKKIPLDVLESNYDRIEDPYCEKLSVIIEPHMKFEKIVQDVLNKFDISSDVFQDYIAKTRQVLNKKQEKNLIEKSDCLLRQCIGAIFDISKTPNSEIKNEVNKISETAMKTLKMDVKQLNDLKKEFLNFIKLTNSSIKFDLSQLDQSQKKWVDEWNNPIWSLYTDEYKVVAIFFNVLKKK